MSEQINPTTGLTGEPTNKNLQLLSEKDFFTPTESTEMRVRPVIGVSDSKYNNNLPREAFFNPEVLEATRAANQPWHHEMGNALVQFGAETLGGTIEAGGYIQELLKGNALAVNTDNALLQLGADIKEAASDDFKIYNANPGGFMLGSSENFWQTMVSLGSTLSLMFPSMAFAKGVGLAGKALSFASRGSMINKALTLSKGTKYVRDGLSSAMFSRQIESNMEASELYKSLINEGVSEDEALARASDLYAKNWVMLLQDIPQYLTLGKVFNPTTGKMVRPKDMFKAVEKSGIDSYVVAALSEAGEEGFQYLASQIERNEGLFNSGKEDYKSLGKIIGDATTDPEFWNSAIMGALGGAVFKGAFDNMGKVLNKGDIKRHNDLKAQFLSERGSKFAELGKVIQEADASGDIQKSIDARKVWNFQRSLDALNLGQESFNNHIEFLENLQNLNQEEIEMLKENGVELDPEVIQQIVPELITQAKEIYNIHNDHLNKTDNQRHATDLTANRVRADIHRSTIAKSTEELEKLRKEVFPEVNNISNDGKALLNLETDLEILEGQLKLANAMKGHYKNDPQSAEIVNDRIEELQQEIVQKKEEVKNFDDSKVTKRDRRNINNIKANSGKYKEYLDRKGHLTNMETQLDILEDEYAKLLTTDEYRRTKDVEDLRKRLNKLSSTNLKGLEEIQQEYEKNGMLGNTMLVEEFNKKRKSVEKGLDVSLAALAKKQLNGTELTPEELQYTVDYYDKYQKIFNKKLEEQQQADPAEKETEALDTTENTEEETDEGPPSETFSTAEVFGEPELAATQEEEGEFGRDLELESILNSEEESGELKKPEPTEQEVNQQKESTIDLYPLLTNKHQSQNPGLTNWLKSPIDKTKYRVRFSITDQFGEGREDVMFTVIDENGNDVTIQLPLNEPLSKKEYEEFVNNGTVSETRIKSIAYKIINGQELSAEELAMRTEVAKKVEEILNNPKLLETTVQGFLLDNQAPNQDYRDKVNVIRNRVKSGKETILKIKNQLPLQLSKPVRGQVKENKITDTFGNNRNFVTVGQTGWIDVNNKESMFFGNRAVPQKFQKGRIHIVVKDNTGQDVPVALNRPRISKEHAEYIASLIKDMLDNNAKLTDFINLDKQENLPIDAKLIGDLTYDNVINHFVYMNTNSASDGTKKGLRNTFYAINGKVVFGENLESRNKNNFNPSELVSFLMAAKRYNVKIDKLKNDAYYEHVVSNLWLNTEKTPGNIFMGIGQIYEEQGVDGNTVKKGYGQGYIYFEDNFEIPQKPRTFESTEPEIKQKPVDSTEQNKPEEESYNTFSTAEIFGEGVALSQTEEGDVESPNEEIINKKMENNTPFESTSDLNFVTEDVTTEDLDIDLNEDLNNQLNDFERNDDVQDNKKC